MSESVRRNGTVLVLGAGASRGVSYRENMACQSPLDADFFDILSQQADSFNWKTADRKTRELYKDVDDVLEDVFDFPSRENLRDSLEKAFYTLHLSAVMQNLITEDFDPEEFLRRFARAISFLLRRAHGKRICRNHKRPFRALTALDSILTFNYDLVVERAFGALYSNVVEFGTWIYGGSPDPPPAKASKVPKIFKLHGSSNWKISGTTFSVRQKSWTEFDEQPGYLGHTVRRDLAGGQGPFPIMLPFWDKKIESKPWSTIWREAARRIFRANNLVVWGYSLPITDIKAYELFTQAFAIRKRGNLRELRLCVIDPSPDARRRWRTTLPNSPFWPYTAVEQFLSAPPPWWVATGN